MARFHSSCSILVLGAGLALGCSSDEAGSRNPGNTGGTGDDGGAGGQGTGGSGGTGGGIGGEGGGIDPPDGGGGIGGEGGSGGCPSECNQDQHCNPDTGECDPNNCDDLDCKDTEICVETADGAHCEDNSCTEDLDCPEEKFCKDGLCVDDTCTPGSTRCDGDTVIECDQNGGGESEKYVCGSASTHFESHCTEGPDGAGCNCEDDWDCPAYTVCDVDRCDGTGKEPTCRLKPGDFGEVPPRQEFAWGGKSPADNQATGSPFPSSAQVVLTPLVANLDDDNGDGRLDERDFPEIVFISFCGSEFQRDGTLRAIHGGGPNKGKDFFATCGSANWHEGDPVDTPCTCEQADLDPTSVPAIGDLDGDGAPEIVAIVEGEGTTRGSVRIYSNRGEIIATSADLDLEGPDPAPAIANLDNVGLAEIVVGRWVFPLEKSSGVIAFDIPLQGTFGTPNAASGPASCIADLAPNAGAEIVSGGTLYRYPKPATDCTNPMTADDQAWCEKTLVRVWAASLPSANNFGFCAIADILGTRRDRPPSPENPLDGIPEIVSIAGGTLHIIAGDTGEVLMTQELAFGNLGGPPNIDDFDGDGFPEIGTAGETSYVVVDLQAPTVVDAECPPWESVDNTNVDRPRTPPSLSCDSDQACGDLTKFACNEGLGECVCLHNGWRRRTEDDSSRVTGSSVFDFNGDGAAEVVYNDECWFRVYDGLGGEVLFLEPSESRTRIEFPVVADVDNDGNAEIVFAASNESGYCSSGPPVGSAFNNGIEVWGDKTDLWVSARRIWNQHAYHITNVTESGQIPLYAVNSWDRLNERFYNTYRSNPRAAFGEAPDLTVRGLQVTSEEVGCGELTDRIQVLTQVTNAGDLRVGPGVLVGFFGDFAGTESELFDAQGQPIRAEITSSLEPGEVAQLGVVYDKANHSSNKLPESVRAEVDIEDSERECKEDNNSRSADVDASGRLLPDLRIAIDAPGECPEPMVEATLTNDGTLAAKNIHVSFYAGKPSSGGQLLLELEVAGPVNPGKSLAVTATLKGFPKRNGVVIYAVVDPDELIEECNDNNNEGKASKALNCEIIQ